MVFLLCMSTYFAVFPAKSVADDNTADADDSFGIILDGGSSGTKLKVYKWNSRSSDSINDRQYINKDVIRDLHLVKSTKFKPSIDKFALRLDELDGYFDTIMQKRCSRNPTEEAWTNTTIFSGNCRVTDSTYQCHRKSSVSHRKILTREFEKSIPHTRE